MLNLEKVCGWWDQGSFSKVLKEWRKRSVTLGAQVRVEAGKGSFEGKVIVVVDIHHPLLSAAGNNMELRPLIETIEPSYLFQTLGIR